jgi:hypothetical protein
VTAVHPSGNFVGKRPARADDGPAESEQSTLKINPEDPGWIKRLVLRFFLKKIVRMFSSANSSWDIVEWNRLSNDE